MVMALVMMSFVLVARLVPAVARAQGIGRQIDVVDFIADTPGPDDERRKEEEWRGKSSHAYPRANRITIHIIR